VPGDRIVQVDDKTSDQVSPDQLADVLRGAEGSLVTVVLKDAEGKSRTLKLTRRRVEVPSVENVRLIDTTAGVGYFRLTSFQKTTPKDVKAALWKLHEEGMRSLVIDLRGNPGGLLKAAVDVADLFVQEGLIVSTRGRSPREDSDHKGELAGTWRVPLVLLIDHDSASASEILAGAVRDHRRGTVVGEKSYGKGSVQGIFPLNTSHTGIRLTTAKWYTPSGQAISGQGIAPDITVQQSAKLIPGQTSLSTSDDAILNAGLQAARKLTTANK
jgi:carboxyl-terminal processing protease